MPKSINDYLGNDRGVVRNSKMDTYKAVTDWWDEKPWDNYPTGRSYKSAPAYAGPPCHHSHPALKLPGSDKVVYGGSILNPFVTDADVYIGLDHGMKLTKKSYPWNPGIEVHFPIADMNTPTDPAEFRKMIEWAKVQIDNGRKVFAGCIAGHGRTGLFLAALVSLYGEKDAIRYVRKNYCSRAVESTKQVAFLVSDYGVKDADATKSYSTYTPATKAGSTTKALSVVGAKDAPITFRALQGKSLWG